MILYNLLTAAFLLAGGVWSGHAANRNLEPWDRILCSGVALLMFFVAASRLHP